MKSKIQIVFPNSKKNEKKSNATLKLQLRELFCAVLTPVQIYVVVLPTVRFFSVKLEHLVELEHFSGKSGT